MHIPVPTIPFSQSIVKKTSEYIVLLISLVHKSLLKRIFVLLISLVHKSLLKRIFVLLISLVHKSLPPFHCSS